MAALLVDLVALWFLVGIWRDDRAMRAIAEESLQVQKDYLSIRRKWYSSRVVKNKDDEKINSRPVDGADANIV